MYIKIKHIKQFLLISACLFFAGFNYFTYVKADDTRIGSQKNCDKAIDSDCDGLTNAEEKLYGTDSNNPDTDGDGYTDGVEVKSGYDPLKPAPGDKIINSASQAGTQTDVTSGNSALTSGFTQELKGFIAAKGTQPVTNTDINNFVTSSLAAKIGEPITLDSLPTVDRSQIKILNQAYLSMNPAERKAQIKTDSQKYFTELIYLILANSPRVITTRDDLYAFGQDFLAHYASLSYSNNDYPYFSDLGNRLDSILTQVADMAVPETMVDLHIKMIRITKGFLALREIQTSANDPISKMALISKVQTLASMATDFLKNDIANYINQL